MYECWVCDQEEEFEFARSQSILTGSFTNPEAAKKMLKQDSPDFSSTDEDFEKSIKMIEDKIEDIPVGKKKKRKLIKKPVA